MRAGRHRDVLLTIDRVADRWRHHTAASIETPDLLQGARIVGHESALPEPGIHEIAGVASTPAQFGRSVRATALISPVTGSSALMLPVVCFRRLLMPPSNRSRGFTGPPWSTKSFCTARLISLQPSEEGM